VPGFEHLVGSHITSRYLSGNDYHSFVPGKQSI